MKVMFGNTHWFTIAENKGIRFDFYWKLKQKLALIKSGKMMFPDYVKEINNKVKKHKDEFTN